MSAARPVKVRLTIRITPRVYTRLARLAAQRGVPAAELARACLLDGLHQLSRGTGGALGEERRWEQLSQTVARLLREPGSAGYRTALIRRLAGLSVDRWEAIDQWVEERAAGAPTRSARLLAKEAVVRFGLPAKILPSVVALAQRVRHRLYMRALREQSP
jgi:hypothetical protein